MIYKINMRMMLLVFAVFLGLQSAAQPAISNELIEIMTGKEADELIPVNIFLHDQYDNETLYSRTATIIDHDERRSVAVNVLKTFAAEQQSGVLEFLQQKEQAGQVQLVHAFWIANFIHCHAKPAAIRELMHRHDIAYIDYDREYEMLDQESLGNYWGNYQDNYQEVIDFNADNANDRSLAWNVTHVQAPQVWAEGFTGEGIVVAVLDTGVNYEHDDLQGNLWEHPNYPNHGYNFIENNFNPMDHQGHGTHVAGTVAGNGSAGTQTGIAPGAKIMALKVLSDQGSGTLAGVIQGIEFAVENGAHLLNLSLGFRSTTSPNRSAMRAAMDNVRNAGSVAMVATGNEGNINISPPHQVRTPGDVPPPWLHPDQTLIGGTSGVISVGSVNSGNNVAPSSSRGPVDWGSVNPYNDYPFNPGMGLIRPDVVAPGVEIVSLNAANTSGYTVKSGTSMAAPAVAGVAALMLSKDPFLMPEDISQILEETAFSLSFIKSNTSGNGVVNAFEAVQAVALGVRYHTHTIDDSDGNDDGKINPGELILLNLAMENPTTETINDLQVILRHESPYIEIIDSIADFGTFEPNEIKELEAAFSFQVAGNIPGNLPIPFKLFSSSGDNQEIWRSGFTEISFAPNIWIGAMEIDDSEGGNNNNVLEPGEHAILKFEVMNTGQIVSEDIQFTLYSQKPYVRVIEQHKSIAPLNPDEGLKVGFLVEAHPSINIASFAEFELVAESGHYEVVRNYKTKLGLIIEDWESGDFSQFDWELSETGVSVWEIDSEEAYLGNYSAKAPDLFSGQFSTLSINIDVLQQDSISFYRKLNIPLSDFANLDFYIDNTRVGRWTGVTDWTREIFSVEPGNRTFSWMYVKSLPPIQDLDAWIDKISLPLSPGEITFAGFDDFTCGVSGFQLNGYALGHHSLTWNTDGDGFFEDDSVLDTYYVPGEEDMQNPHVNISLQTLNADGDPVHTDTMQLSVFPQSPEIALGEDAELCMTETILLDAGEGFEDYLWSNGSTERTLLVTAEEFAPEAEIWVVATDANGCQSYDSVIITFTECVYVIDAYEPLFAMYPNPARQTVTIDADYHNYSVTLLDITGRNLKQRKAISGQVTLNIENLENGLYFVRLVTSSGISTRKLQVMQ